MIDLSQYDLEKLSDEELISLSNLLDELEIDHKKENLCFPPIESNPNYIFLHNAIKEQRYVNKKLVSGYRGCILEGSSRSGKTWSGVDIIIWLCLFVEVDGCTINIYRETYNEFKTTLYDDFKRRLDDFGLPNKFHEAQEIKNFKIGKSTIHFLGDGKHGGGCDYAFFNEGMFINQSVFDQTEMRCRKFWWIDYNPSFSAHWIFNSVEKRPDVGFLRTTFKDNPFISDQELNKIYGYEPWETGSYEIIDDQIFYNGRLVDDTNQPPPHKVNIENGTANEFMWKCYGLGLRGAQTGVIFPYVRYIDEFPQDLGYIYGNDFGFTNDPNALVKYSETENDIFVELLLYESIDHPDTLALAYDSMWIEDDLPIVCDSSDKYTGENKGTVEMVTGLQEHGYNAFKVAKKKGIVYWLGYMRKKRINIVKSKHYESAKTEQQNYKWKEINGIAINQPIDKHNHFWDATRYCCMEWNNDFDDVELVT